MREDLENCSLLIQDGLTGDIVRLGDFFKPGLSTFSRESMLSDYILPMIFDRKNIYITIGDKMSPPHFS